MLLIIVKSCFNNLFIKKKKRNKHFDKLCETFTTVFINLFRKKKNIIIIRKNSHKNIY